MPESLTHLADKIQAIFPEEFTSKDSRDKLYKFLALHLSYYFRYPSTVSVDIILVLYLCNNYESSRGRATQRTYIRVSLIQFSEIPPYVSGLKNLGLPMKT